MVMTPRERVLTAMRRQQPDRVPRFLDYTSFAPGLMEIFKKKTGADNPDEFFDYDLRIVRFGPTKCTRWAERYNSMELPAGAYVDNEWGNIHMPARDGNARRVFRYALEGCETAEDIESYPMPDMLEPYRWEHLKAETEVLHARGYAVMGYMSQTLFESAWKIRGFENFLADIVINDELTEALLDKLASLRCEQAAIYAGCGVDIIRIGDDVGNERGMLFSPALFRKWLKPRLEAVIRAARRVKPDVLILYHSDGDCRDIIPDLIDIGVDILNPVQPECMDPAVIKSLYGNNLAFAGTIGTQTTMPFGTPEDVKSEVRLRVNTVGNGGGLLLCPSHLLQDDVPWENVTAFFEAVEAFGVYEIEQGSGR